MVGPTCRLRKPVPPVDAATGAASVIGRTRRQNHCTRTTMFVWFSRSGENLSLYSGLGENPAHNTIQRKQSYFMCGHCRENRKELITSVAAGKSYSLATNVQGQLLAWGKGWEGQLGLGKVKDVRVRK